VGAHGNGYAYIEPTPRSRSDGEELEAVEGASCTRSIGSQLAVQSAALVSQTRLTTRKVEQTRTRVRDRPGVNERFESIQDDGLWMGVASPNGGARITHHAPHDPRMTSRSQPRGVHRRPRRLPAALPPLKLGGPKRISRRTFRHDMMVEDTSEPSGCGTRTISGAAAPRSECLRGRFEAGSNLVLVPLLVDFRGPLLVERRPVPCTGARPNEELGELRTAAHARIRTNSIRSCSLK
jgi:hypothetical protein